MAKLLLTKRAQRDLVSIPLQIQRRLVGALDELTEKGTSASNTKKLRTPFPGYRKRVGDYRILFEVNEEIAVIYRISKRSEAYR
jgi:mRNA interferase RelE/StbE